MYDAVNTPTLYQTTDELDFHRESIYHEIQTMEESKENWKLPTLGRSNYEQWFRQMRIKLRGKGVFYTVDQTRVQFAGIASVGDITKEMEDLTIKEDGTEKKVRINIEKGAKYSKDEATALMYICQPLNDDDQALIDEYETAKSLWDYLKSKYSKTDATTANIYMTKIQTFQFNNDFTVISAWDRLKDYRRKLYAASTSAQNAYPDEALLLVLIRSLPKLYTATIDALDVQTQLSVDGKLKYLEAKESRVNEENENDHAHAAFKKPGRYVLPQKRNSFSPSESEHSDKYQCYLCDGRHLMRNCKNLARARRLLKEYKQDKASGKSRSQHQTNRTAKPATEETLRKGYGKDKAVNRKTHGYSAESKRSYYESDYSTSDNTDNTASDLEEEVIETCGVSKEVTCKITPSSWASDTGASSHMSDQPSLFRRLIPIKRRTIKVGGGQLYAWYTGTVDIVCKDGSSLVLSDVLYVPNLGINLLSGKRMCEAGLEGIFDTTKMYFLADKKRIITATMNRGLYILTHVSKKCRERAFLSVGEGETTTSTGTVQTSAIPQEELKTELKTHEKQVYLLWHKRFAHLGPDKICNLHKVTTLEKAVKVPSKREICEVCTLTKMTNVIPRKLSEWRDTKLALIQFDIAGPFPVSLRGNRYFILIIDNFSRKNWEIPIAHKGDAVQELQTWKKVEEQQSDEKVKAARSDNAPELLLAIEGWRKQDGVRSEPTTIASSYQNGPAERNIRTAEENMRAMLKEARLPMEFWDEAVEADAYLRNRTQTGPVIDGIQVSPEEAYTGNKPSIDHIRIWGSKCFSYINPKTIPAQQRHDKLVDRGRVGVFMGYSETTSKQLKIYSPELGYTFRSSRVLIDETTPGGTIDLRIRNCASGPQGTQNVLPDRKPRGRPRKEAEAPAIQSVSHVPELSHSQLQDTPIDNRSIQGETILHAEIPLFIAPRNIPTAPDEELNTISRQKSLQEKESVSTLPADMPLKEPELQPQPEDIVQPNENHHYFTRSKRKRSDSSTGEDERFHKVVRAMVASIRGYTEELETDTDSTEVAFPAGFIHGISIPQTYQQAVDDPKYSRQWKAAMAEEILSLQANGTWKEVVLPAKVNLVSTKWVYTVKTKADGTIDRFKARLVARGFSQIPGQDYTETFAPTARTDTLRLFLSMAAAEDLECYQFDIKNAFTESHLKEEIYLSAPKGLNVKKGHVLQALRSLYGLKQAARDWNLLIKKELLSWNLTQSLADPCLYTHPNGLQILVYVDDIVAVARSIKDIDWFYGLLSQRFHAKNLGETEKILGIRVIRDRPNRTIYLDQEQYITEVLARFGITNKTHKEKKIPAADYESLRPASDNDTRINITEYQQVIGSLMFAMVTTRPDIAFVLGKLSQYMSDPAEHHGHALKALMRYLKSTVKQKLRYGPGGVYNYFVMYSDADWGSDKSTRKSVSGSVAMFYGGPISWSSKKQRSISTSSCESEYIAMSACTKQGQWIAQVFRDLKLGKYIGKDPSLVQMLGDNQGALALVKDPRLHERSKHIDICYHYIRDLAEQGKVAVTYIPTADMVADGMTKPLARIAFERFKSQLGVLM